MTGADFTGGVLPSGTLTFAAADSVKTVTINVAGDTTAEFDENFSLVVVDKTGLTPNVASALGRILNDDDDVGVGTAAATLALPGSRAAFVDTATDTDWFKVTLNSGTTYRFVASFGMHWLTSACSCAMPARPCC